MMQNKTEKSERKALVADRSCSRFDKTNGDNDYRMLFSVVSAAHSKVGTVTECYSTQKLLGLCHPKQYAR